MPVDYFPRLLVRSPERIAREGYEGLKAGRRVVVPGFLNKMITLTAYSPLRHLSARSQARRHRARIEHAKSRDHSTSSG
jgi:short-subunit dehydrogenase